jgi:SET domain-containing protein
MAKGKYTLGRLTLVVRRSRTGRGLFTLEGIAKGQCIVEYTGRLLSQAAFRASRGKYLFKISETKTIDGWQKSNVARYINHSCRPNCEIEIWRRRVYVMAKRAIKSGEELSYDYGPEYFDAHIRPKGCHCGKCQGSKGKA